MRERGFEARKYGLGDVNCGIKPPITVKGFFEGNIF